eukprot:CAMPEP_0197851416 /NCGR_PEP_ID=MMETSP1438-20131217/18041_1 /TAXON_ID=1461541 /ORGANISM="Pterosperma sp., Strain CCMP1384" /LENGTH=51 /DNA_ID=CAMNT_0043465009 /DNA_START=117 /DNA_END=268 /DNA_ORIENTATION=+
MASRSAGTYRMGMERGLDARKDCLLNVPRDCVYCDQLCMVMGSESEIEAVS